ncbi:PhoH family protein [Hyphobacterium sp.]|uniref:PhoH family protein n=1 Tax=Hyphobacterium sp. TaxID=2004662 RepID=UPI003B527882
MPDLATIAPAEPAPTHKANVAVPEALSAHLRDNTGLRHSAHAAVAPYHMALKETASGIEVSGDAPAVLVMQRWLEKAAASWRTTGPHDVPDGASLRSAIDGALKRDLVLRLAGLPKPVRPLTLTQHAYIEALIEGRAPVIMASGPTGTGKTHLALAAGLSLLETGAVQHMIVARPNVAREGQVMTAELRNNRVYDESFAGIEDELNDLVGPDVVHRLQASRKLEICPVGHLQGRTFGHAFMVIDEAQNMNVRTTRMVVSRLGEKSRIVLVGDPDHCDMREDGRSGFDHLTSLVEGEDFARIIRFEVPDIVRNPVVARLETLYGRDGGAG